MKGESRVVIRYAAYGVVTLLLTVYFMFLTFPFSKLQSRLLPRLEAALSLRITVQEIRASPLLWLTLLDVQVFPQTGERTPLLEITECKVRPSLLDLIIGRPSLRVRTALLGGTLAGKVVRRKGNLDMAFSWKGIQPARHPLLSTGETPIIVCAKKCY